MTITYYKIIAVKVYVLITNRVICIFLDTVKAKKHFRLINMHYG